MIIDIYTFYVPLRSSVCFCGDSTNIRFRTFISANIPKYYLFEMYAA